MVQLRNIPAELRRRLKARAAVEGMSMSAYVLRELRNALERPTRQEVLERLAARAGEAAAADSGRRDSRRARRRVIVLHASSMVDRPVSVAR